MDKLEIHLEESCLVLLVCDYCVELGKVYDGFKVYVCGFDDGLIFCCCCCYWWVVCYFRHGGFEGFELNLDDLRKKLTPPIPLRQHSHSSSLTWPSCSILLFTSFYSFSCMCLFLVFAVFKMTSSSTPYGCIQSLA